MYGIINLIILGILLGGVYALIGLGLSISFGITRIINVSHGNFVLLSTYLAYLFLTRMAIDPFITLAISCPILFLIGYGMQKFALNRLIPRGDETIIVFTFGIALILENLYLYIFSPMTRGLITPYTLISFDIIGLHIPFTYLIGFILALIIAICSKLFFDRTFLGLAIKAVTQDREASLLMGINNEFIRSLALGISLVVAAIAGVSLGTIMPFTPSTGWGFLLFAFGIIVVGGVGSIIGTFIGGIVLAESQLLGGYYFGIGWSLFFGYLIIILFLAFRPKGIFGK
ncbi:MAG: branched-chain amino acid ABC transporter permease [Candidatus Bathyarchaeia archaeon]